ncbi:MAG: carboxypeptidase-like regulatory domain-containing protein [Ekhidna sp.]|nr:carboxypeptidase-like regulatory domain-containing protein [Ekhidna sp.]
MRIRLVIPLLLLLSFSTFSQTGIKGITGNEAGEILPFSTVYIKGTTVGTTSNASGRFFLKTPSGNHTIVAQHIGYKTLEKKVSISEGSALSIDFVLEEQALQLKTVVVTGSDEDPAYRIIREAMEKRKFYKNEVNAFKADAYLKGLFRLDKRPEQILGQKITIDTGIVYLSESVSKFSFEMPDKVSETMISSKVSGDDQGFSFNQASDFNINAYSKNIDLNMERAYVSPISGQAFLFYDYELLGIFEENGKSINKIRLLPKRATDPVFEGIVYIVEDEWRFHSIDLLVTKKRGLEFIDSLKINQVFAPVDHDIWMPLSQNFSFRFGAFGFKGSGYYIGVFSNYEIEPNYEMYEETGLYQEKFGNEEKKDLFREEDFTPEILFVEEKSNERDSAYWRDTRPIPLTIIEEKDYRIKDSVRVVKESVSYKDSVDAETNKLTLGNILSGYTHSNSIKEQYWTIPSILSLLQYNTVEGFVPEVQSTYLKQVNERTKYWIRPSIRYGFSNERFNAKLEGSYRKLDDKFTQFYAGGGRYISQFNEEGIITPFVNSYLTLFSGDNYLKIFEKSFAYTRFRQEVKNGVLFTGNLEYSSRDTLTNTTDYIWTKSENINFTGNQPSNQEISETGFESHQALIATAGFRFRIKQKYATRPDGKIIYASKYPEFTFTYKKAFKVFGADLDYDFIELRITDEVPLGLVGTSNWAIAGGGFLNKNELTFVDFRHFAGNQTNFSQVDRPLKFELLPFYEFSTSDSFIEAHYEHHFNEFIFNKIPLIRKLNLQAVGSANYLYTDTLGNYVEAGAGIEHIFKFLRLDYYWAYRNGNFFAKGYRIGVGF